jgi:hypothetical protein
VFQWQFDEAQMTVDNVGAPVTPAQWNYIHRQVIQHNDDIRCRRKMFNFFHTALPYKNLDPGFKPVSWKNLDNLVAHAGGECAEFYFVYSEF